MEELLKLVDKNKILAYAGIAETLGQLHPEVIEIAIKEQWFKLYVPEVYGGPAKILPEILRLLEELAYLDGSLGWTVTLCSGAGWFAGFLDPELAKEVFANREVCFAGSGAVGGTAIKTDNGYVLNGHWNYASGALHATIFTANCKLENADGSPVLSTDGEQLISSFILFKDEINILPGWSYFGLIATGSHAFEAKDLHVPLNRTFQINKEIKVDIPGFDYPFLQLAETTLAVNSAGMAKHFLQLTEELFYGRTGIKRYKENQMLYFDAEFKQCKAEFEQVRNVFYEAFDLSWSSLINEKSIKEDLLKEVSLVSRKLAHTSRRITDTLFPYCGLEAAKKESEINRVWRDIHTASQHSLLTFED
ncbi:acyl-CoA dehydrogenase [Pedobacter polaris]|uniref:Acyl-CoA dehydrogenase n=1 Tax=Pedobacter polaris TaxID=2571273 RepID=A0A4U1CQW0_9SPHI|nr:acyl-CoA dehydrogenase [Pedobacter polaris]TKC08112.1 acyl-CoA dehydrogenase [Pedobacter polaris]